MTKVPELPELPEPATPPDHELETAILGDRPRLSAADVAAEHQIPIDGARRLWRALGFPEPGSARVFTPADSEALGTALRLVDSGVLDLDLAVNLARGVGQTMARLSDWQVSALTARVEEVARREGGEASPETDRKSVV